MVNLPKVALRSKLFTAKLLGNVIKNSLTFKIKRSAMRRFKSTDFDTVIVDMDGTIYKSDANLEGLCVFYPSVVEGEVEGVKIYSALVDKIASGQYSVEQAIVEGNEYFIKKGMSKTDFKKVYEHIQPGLRKKLVKALKNLKADGKTLVLATLSSKDFGDYLNKQLKKDFDFEFDFVVGTQLSFDEIGKVNGISSIVGMKDGDLNGVKVKSKLTAIKDAFQEAGKEFTLNKSVLITDSYSDIDLGKMIVTILIKPRKSTKAQKVSQSLKLADYILYDDVYLKTNLESILLGPEK